MWMCNVPGEKSFLCITALLIGPDDWKWQEILGRSAVMRSKDLSSGKIDFPVTPHRLEHPKAYSIQNGHQWAPLILLWTELIRP